MDAQHSQPKPSRSGLAIAALVLGIVAMATSFLPIINNASFFVAIVGFVLAIVGIVGTGKGKKSGRGMAIAGLVLSVVAVVAVLGSQAFYGAAIDSATDQMNKQFDKMSGDATEDILGHDVDVKLGELTMSKDQYGIVTSKLPVTITNKLDEKTTYWVKIEAVDGSGARIDDDTVYASDLGPNQSTTLDAFTFLTSSDYEAMKNAKHFNVVSVSEM